MIMKKYSILFACLFVLSACADKGMDDLKQFVAHEKRKKSGTISPLPEFVQLKMYSYDSADIRDPFVPVVDVEIVTKKGYTGPTPDENRIKEPLESFALDSLRMKGILKQEGVSWVLIQDPDGLLHRVTVGNYVGLNNGKITKLYDDSIEIEELIPDGKGWEKRQTGMAMSE